MVNIAINDLGCAAAIPAGDPASSLAGGFATSVENLAKDPNLLILVDDRSGLFEALVDFRKERGETSVARSTAQSWSELLDAHAAAAKTPAERVVFDAHRLLAYTELGALDKAEAMLRTSEGDFPENYNPPARLARAYLDDKKFDDALEATDRALSKVYGPRRLRIYSLRSDILAA